MSERNPALAAFRYVAACFALLGQVFGLTALGAFIAGDYGAFLGGVVGLFILFWVVCWYMTVS